MTDHLNFLEDCVRVTEGCVLTANRALVKLEPGVRDLPRLTKILRNQHHFLLLPSPLLQQYKSELATELGPRVEMLVGRAEGLIGGGTGRQGGKVDVGGLCERKVVLEERLALLQAQAAQQARSAPSVARAQLESSGGGPTDQSEARALDTSTLDPTQKRKLAMLKGKRERLERELGRMG